MEMEDKEANPLLKIPLHFLRRKIASGEQTGYKRNHE